MKPITLSSPYTEKAPIIGCSQESVSLSLLYQRSALNYPYFRHFAHWCHPIMALTQSQHVISTSAVLLLSQLVYICHVRDSLKQPVDLVTKLIVNNITSDKLSLVKLRLFRVVQVTIKGTAGTLFRTNLERTSKQISS